jgi:hypothetical protein
VLVTRIVGRGIDTLVLNVCYADKQFQPIKQELDQNLQQVILSPGVSHFPWFSPGSAVNIGL